MKGFRGYCYVDAEFETLVDAARFETRLGELTKALKEEFNGIHYGHKVKEYRNTKKGPPDINKMKFRSN